MGGEGVFGHRGVWRLLLAATSWEPWKANVLRCVGSPTQSSSLPTLHNRVLSPLNVRSAGTETHLPSPSHSEGHRLRGVAVLSQALWGSWDQTKSSALPTLLCSLFWLELDLEKSQVISQERLGPTTGMQGKMEEGWRGFG